MSPEPETDERSRMLQMLADYHAETETKYVALSTRVAKLERKSKTLIDWSDPVMVGAVALAVITFLPAILESINLCRSLFSSPPPSLSPSSFAPTVSRVR